MKPRDEKRVVREDGRQSDVEKRLCIKHSIWRVYTMIRVLRELKDKEAQKR